ncbi:MAG: cell division protein FtsK [Opitutia bacterium Tous-C8FEB]|nr:MAG: cell division protein FtsK [Opitutae bacterium Tous-C8FEB]
MPKAESSNTFATTTRAPILWGLALGAALGGAYLTVALATYDPSQSPYDHQPLPTVRGPAGIVGAYLAASVYRMLGFAGWLLPLFLAWLVYLAVRGSRRVTQARVLTMVLGLLTGAGIAAMFAAETWRSNWCPAGPGGFIGLWLYHGFLEPLLGGFGAGLLLVSVYIACLVFIFFSDLAGEFQRALAAFAAWRAERAQLAAERSAQRQQEAELLRKAQAAAAAKEAAAKGKPVAPPTPALIGPSGPKVAAPKADGDPLTRRAPRTPAPEPADEPLPPPAKPTPVAEKPAPAPVAPKVALTIVKPEEPRKAARVALPQSEDKNYQFPPLSLLREQVRPSAGDSEEEHRQNAINLLRILSEFGVEVTLGEIHVGPVITRYEVVPAPGVRVEKISGLDKNIALGMRAQSVRILAPIPGKAAVGVEVPNQRPTPVGMRELLESEDWGGTKAEIPIALGKDVSGAPLVSDLAKMPHLLIAGATGSGKSVCINSIVASILYSKSPKDLRMIMVDPKVVELKIFNSLPHMLIPVVTEPKKVPAALKWLLKEMEQRYQIFAKVNVRNIVGFNQRKRGGEEPPPPPEAQGTLEGVDPLAGVEIPDRLPYIVAIIDELADLMAVAPADIETNIARLAQLARAAGIHLIIATQRPSVNVITGVIKANLPSRIAFQVASQVDSRTILDTKGADTLIGRGDMLFSPPGSSRLVRAQGAFVSDEEVQAMVEHLKRNGPPQYAQSVQQQIDRAAREDEDGEGEDGDLGDDDELYHEAMEVLKATRRASTSMLQRKLKIGYNRAARIMEIMEEKGIVGPENGSSPREILVDLDSL